MTVASSSATFFDNPFLNDSFFTLADLFSAATHAQKRKEGSESSNNSGPGSNREIIFIPRMDIHESKTNNEITVTFELPGMRKEDVTVDIQQNRLTVSGRNTVSSEIDKEAVYKVRERRLGRFVRVIALPGGLKPENLKARMENGVLTIQFPRTVGGTAPKRVHTTIIINVNTKLCLQATARRRLMGLGTVVESVTTEMTYPVIVE